MDALNIEGLSSIPSSSLIVFALPMNVLDNVSKMVFERLAEGSLIVDMSSEKTETSKILDHNSKGRFQIVGVHPLFGPTVPSPIGQNIVITGFSDANEKHVWLLNYLTNIGFLTKITTPCIHDDAMLYVQVLTHFALLSFSKVLTSSKIPISNLLEFRTPPFMFLSSFAGRLLKANALTYANIQRRSDAPIIRTEFMKAVKELASAFDSDKDLDVSIDAIKNIVVPLKGCEVAECVAISDKAVDAIQEFERRLYELRGNGNICGLRRVDNERVVVGVIKKIRHDWISLELRTKDVVDKQGNRKVAVCIDDCVKKRYQRYGIKFGEFESITLIKRNIRILSDADLNEWIEKNLWKINGDINIKTDARMSKYFYENWLPRIVPGLYDIIYCDEFLTKENEKRIRLNVTVHPTLSFNSTIETIETFLREISAIDYA